MEMQGLRIFDPLSADAQLERAIIYSRSGFGKSRLWASLTPRFGEILLYAADHSSEFMASTTVAKKKRVRILKPTTGDPTKCFQEFCIRDWRPIFPDVKTIVVDTYTQVIQDSLQYSAATGAVTAEKHFVVGDPKAGGQVIPNRGDYRAIASLSRGFLRSLFLHQAHYNIILVCHEDSKAFEGINIGGPAHAGWEMSEELPGHFSTVIRLVKEPLLVPGRDVPEMKVIAVTESDGKYIAKLRESDEKNGNPMKRVVLDEDPTNFWVRYDELFAPKVEV